MGVRRIEETPYFAELRNCCNLITGIHTARHRAEVAATNLEEHPCLAILYLITPNGQRRLYRTTLNFLRKFTRRFSTRSSNPGCQQAVNRSVKLTGNTKGLNRETLKRCRRSTGLSAFPKDYRIGTHKGRTTSNALPITREFNQVQPETFVPACC